MRSEARARLGAVLVLLASCASADDLMHAYTGRQAGSGQDPGAEFDLASDPGLTEVPDVGPETPPDEAGDEAVAPDVPDVCVPSWSCGGWTACGCENTQTRTCTDANGCGTTAGKPSEIQACDHCGNGSCDCGETNGTCPSDCPAVSCPTGYVLVPAGQFTMGSPESDPCRNSDEVQHQVTISKGFCLKETEVTQGEWQAVMGNNPSYFSSCGSSCPVEQVSWWDAVAYCNMLSLNEGLQPCYDLSSCSGTPGTGNYTCPSAPEFVGVTCTGYRLPTESEWEYAARAGTTGGTYNGTSATCDCTKPNGVLDPIAWWCGNASSTKPVKGKQANAWGLYDMLGNVWEWCWDWYGTYPTGSVADPLGAATGSDRVRRGGCWDSTPVGARAADRYYGAPGFRDRYLGFRPARSIP